LNTEVRNSNYHHNLRSNNFCANFFATKCTKIIHNVISFFRDCARKKWPLKGSKSAVYLVTQSIGFRCQEGESLIPETESVYGGKPSFSDNMLSDKSR